mgnify:FL=1
MKEKLDLQGKDWEQQLQQALADMPPEPMPPGLQRKLQRIPRDHTERSPWWRSGWLRPAMAFTFIAMPLALGLALQQRQIHEQERQLAQAQQDLAVALRYLQKANERVASQVATRIATGVAQPVTDTTVQVIEKTLEPKQEYEL